MNVLNQYLLLCGVFPQSFPPCPYQPSICKSVGAVLQATGSGSDRLSCAQAPKDPTLDRQIRHGVCLCFGAPHPLLDGHRFLQMCEVATEDARSVGLLEQLDRKTEEELCGKGRLDERCQYQREIYNAIRTSSTRTDVAGSLQTDRGG